MATKIKSGKRKVLEAKQSTKGDKSKLLREKKRKIQDTEVDNHTPTNHTKAETRVPAEPIQISLPQPQKKTEKHGDYYAIPYCFGQNGALRQLLVKNDTVNNVLRITNLSIGLEEEVLKKIFISFEPTTVKLENTFEIAISYTNQDKDFDKFVKTLKVPIVLDENKVPTLESFVTNNKEVSSTTLRQQLDEYMHNYDATTGGDNKFQRKRPALQRDSDGFKVAVSRANLVRAEHGARREKTIEVLQQREKAKQLTNFYKFQKAERFQAKQVEQTKKVENDKKRIAQMVKQGKFKPF